MECHAKHFCAVAKDSGDVTISIITVALNSADTIGQCIDSVMRQNCSIDHVVVDGQSSDGTVEIVRKYGNSLRFISERDGGVYEAMNKGLHLARGDVIGFLHSDDMLADANVVPRLIDIFKDRSVHAVYGDLIYVNRTKADRVIRYWRAGVFSPSKLKWGWMPPHPALYVRREIYGQIGGFDTSYRIAGDYDFMLRLLTLPGLKMSYIPTVLVKMRVGGVSNRSLGTMVKKSIEDYRALRANNVGSWPSLVSKNLSKLHQFFGTPPR